MPRGTGPRCPGLLIRAPPRPNQRLSRRDELGRLSIQRGVVSASSRTRPGREPEQRPGGQSPSGIYQLSTAVPACFVVSQAIARLRRVTNTASERTRRQYRNREGWCVAVAGQRALRDLDQTPGFHCPRRFRAVRSGGRTITLPNSAVATVTVLGRSGRPSSDGSSALEVPPQPPVARPVLSRLPPEAVPGGTQDAYLKPPGWGCESPQGSDVNSASEKDCERS